MSKPVLLLAAALSLFLPIGCCTASGSPVTPSTAQGENLLRFAGQIVYVPLEGGFFGLVSDDGRRFDPVNLPARFRQDGLRIKVTGRLAAAGVGFHMWGSRLEIIAIERE